MIKRYTYMVNGIHVNQLNLDMNMNMVIPRSRSVVATLNKRVLAVEAIIVNWRIVDFK